MIQEKGRQTVIAPEKDPKFPLASIVLIILELTQVRKLVTIYRESPRRK